MFSHMVVMFAYALYRQGFAEKAWKVLDGLYQQSQDFQTSRMYPGIPEYFNPRGRGMYPYLTGSAAWYLFTLLTESFGIKGLLGDLCIEPKLVTEQFSNGDQISVHTVFAGKNLQVVFRNSELLSYSDYGIGKITINGAHRDIISGIRSIRIPRQEITRWPDTVKILIDLT